MASPIIKIDCPPVGLSKEERLQILFKEIQKWIHSEPLRRLMDILVENIYNLIRSVDEPRLH